MQECQIGPQNRLGLDVEPLVAQDGRGVTPDKRSFDAAIERNCEWNQEQPRAWG